MRARDPSPFEPLTHDDGSPVFGEPWQAQALALADTLARSGIFTPAQWSEALGAALRHAGSAGEPDTPATYYAAVVEALEELLEHTGAVSHDMVAARLEAWREAYRTTPHGQPVELPRR